MLLHGEKSDKVLNRVQFPQTNTGSRNNEGERVDRHVTRRICKLGIFAYRYQADPQPLESVERQRKDRDLGPNWKTKNFFKIS